MLAGVWLQRVLWRTVSGSGALQIGRCDGVGVVVRVGNAAFKTANFIIQLGLELSAGLLKLTQNLSNLPGDLRQLLGPEEQKAQKQNEEHLADAAKSHGFMIPVFPRTCLYTWPLTVTKPGLIHLTIWHEIMFR